MLRDEWRDVVVLLIDECSLVSCELMSELDSALRFAKEKHDQWFGGITVIFAGDFYQYPPVGGTALYTPIPAYSSQSNEEISKRLGQMAWKAINSVVTLTEQERMKEDPEYGAAVQRLRIRECTLEDLELFNSRVIKSVTNEGGVDMSAPVNFPAAAIVRTNLLRETLNLRKAQTNSAKTNRRLIVCAAMDKCATQTLTRLDREQLLNLNLTSSRLQNALPGFVPLYVGMPVVLRMKNISTDLGITNGSQGYVRQIYTSICPVGFTYCTCAIVEFPDSKVSLPGLPKGYFPILPTKWTFTTLLTTEDGTTVSIQLTRNQLPVQPGFAVTGQSAQGKTLPSVVANLHEGGFGAYVAASRARTQQGLCITEPVTLQQLNKPVPHSLMADAAQLDALEHNTYVHYGFSQEPLRTVPDPESERRQGKTMFIASFETPEHKRKRVNDESGQSVTTTPIPKRPRISKPTQRSAREITPVYAGCTWDNVDWSCAYDSVVMTVFYSYLFFSVPSRQTWRELTPLNRALAQSFDSLISSPTRMSSGNEYNIIRNGLRDFLSSRDPDRFPRHGAVGAPVDLIFDYLSLRNLGALTVMYTCPSLPICGPPSLIPTDHNLPLILNNVRWTEWSSAPQDIMDKAPIQTWINNALRSRQEDTDLIPPSIPCDAPCDSARHSTICLTSPPPLLTIEVTPGTYPTVLPSMTLKIPGPQRVENYTLRAVIYLGQFHFTARMFDLQGNVWSHDGRKNNGRPWLDNSCGSSTNGIDRERITTFDGRSAYLYLYSLQQ
jgi:hypothetical protein